VTPEERRNRQFFSTVSRTAHAPTRGKASTTGADPIIRDVSLGRSIYDFLRVLAGIVGTYPARLPKLTWSIQLGWAEPSPTHDSSKDVSQTTGKSGCSHRERGALRRRVGRPRSEYDDVTGFVQWRFPKGPRSGLAARLEAAGKARRAPSSRGSSLAGTNRSLGIRMEFPGDGVRRKGRRTMCFRLRRVSSRQDEIVTARSGSRFLADRCLLRLGPSGGGGTGSAGSSGVSGPRFLGHEDE